MLFNSYPFLFGFFPVVFAGFFLLARKSHAGAAVWLGLASLVFYGWWSPAAVFLLLGSVCANYWFGQQLVPARLSAAGGRSERSRKLLLWLAVGANLALLAFFKYADFLIANLNLVLGEWNAPKLEPLGIPLPIGISFYTFTQIAFLVDCWQGKVLERKFRHYLLFVTYFPHLIAGPVLHHKQMMPQFAQAETYRLHLDKLALGAFIFAIGLAKKLLIADSLAESADVLFGGVPFGVQPKFLMAWLGVLAYAFQIYFDFSGYSDMALGLSLCFGIRLPINFDSPYRATSIIEFWRRWHISLSTFLRDYLYIPLGGNRLGRLRRYLNLMVTMLLGGLWHGASWTFVLWGAAHGAMLAVNHLWSEWFGSGARRGPVARVACWALTFVCVCLAWVLFRADSLDSAGKIYAGMFGLNGFSLPAPLSEKLAGLRSFASLSFDGVWQGLAGPSMLTLLGGLAAALLISVACPPVARIYEQGASFRIGRWPLFDRRVGFAVGLLLAFAVLSIGKLSPFLYFQF